MTFFYLMWTMQNWSVNSLMVTMAALVSQDSCVSINSTTLLKDISWTILVSFKLRLQLMMRILGVSAQNQTGKELRDEMLMLKYRIVSTLSFIFLYFRFSLHFLKVTYIIYSTLFCSPEIRKHHLS